MSVQLSKAAYETRRFLRRGYRRLRERGRRGRVTFRLLTRSAIAALVPGSAARRSYLMLPSAGYSPGLFSQFATVLGLLDHFDDWRHRYAGLRVDFANEGLYYDPTAGNNWWEYYFEQLTIGSMTRARPAVVAEDESFYFARRVETAMPRRRGYELIDRYIRLRAHIRVMAETYAGEHFGDARVIGVHYRGTDKHEDAPRVRYEEVRAAVRAAVDVAKCDRYAVFLATDEQAFLDYMREQFPGRLHYREMHRSVDGAPIDTVSGDNYRKGEDAVLDCLLLARCDYLVRTASNLSLCSTFFNPTLPVVLLNPER